MGETDDDVDGDCYNVSDDDDDLCDDLCDDNVIHVRGDCACGVWDDDDGVGVYYGGGVDVDGHWYTVVAVALILPSMKRQMRNVDECRVCYCILHRGRGRRSQTPI